MAREVIDMTEKVCGRLTVIERAEVGMDHNARWRCLCECGKSVTISGSNLRRGTTRSCGCLQRQLAAVAIAERRTATHGMKGTPTYKSWVNAKQRCGNPRYHKFESHGGRGISMCDKWSKSFEAFLEDMGVRPSGTSLDRYPNNDGNYEPGNCRWATPVEQSSNTRTNVLVEHDGRSQTVAAWAREFGLARGTLGNRLKSGWSIERALQEPSKA
jgi:hypothetical protein